MSPNAPQILLVDDNADLVHVMGLVLQDQLPQARLLTFSDPRAALAAALQGRVQAVVSDLEMPFVTGADLARAVRDGCEPAAAPLLIAMSGNHGQLATAREARLFDHVFSKPVDMERLAQLLRAHTAVPAPGPTSTKTQMPTPATTPADTAADTAADTDPAAAPPATTAADTAAAAAEASTGPATPSVAGLTGDTATALAAPGPTTRLSDFIEAYQDRIVAECVAFARGITALTDSDVTVLRDHIPEMLRVVTADMRSPQSKAESIAKSRGVAAAAHLYTQADGHGKQRAREGLNMDQLLAEYRALRACVLRLWGEHHPDPQHVVQDITRFNEAIDQAVAESVRTFAKEVEHRRQVFLAALGHDLRSPLHAAMLTSTAILKLAPQAPPQLAGFANVLSRSVARMSRLLDSLLDYNLVGLGKSMTLNRVATDLRPACEEEIEMLRTAFPGAHIELRVAGNCLGAFDVSRIREALGNLVSNAARHGVAGRPISVVMQGLPDSVEIMVSNTVTRVFSDTELHDLFEPLRRGASNQQAPRTSLGLGLFITQEIAQAHGGGVDATCVDETIHFTLRAPKVAEADCG